MIIVGGDLELSCHISITTGLKANFGHQNLACLQTLIIAIGSAQGSAKVPGKPLPKGGKDI